MYILLSCMDTSGHFYGSFRDTDISNLNNLINPDAMMDQLYITDMEINRFINFLKSRYDYEGLNRFENSRIVITSDHGMSSMKDAAHSGDIRNELNNENIQIRANTKWLPFGFNDNGNYEWFFSEGTHGYIFCKENEQKEIVDVLKKLPYVESNLIFDKKKQKKNKMWKGNYEDVIWPMIIFYLKPNYSQRVYSDQVASIFADFPNISMIIAKILDVLTLPGTHGTTSEQNVPLIFISPGEEEIPQNVVIDSEVSVIDIAPSISYLQWNKIPKSFEGKSLFPLKRISGKIKKKKNE